jgi:hypothetical protein
MIHGKSQILLAFALICAVFLYSSGARAGTEPAVGSYMPDLKIQPPALEKDRQYLGLDGTQAFTAGQVDSPFILIEIVGVYCPHCHAQAPLFNALYNRIKKNPEMDPKIKMLAVAVGATPIEVDYMRNLLNIPFPLIQDPDFDVHKALGEPRTPFVLVASKDKKVLFTHVGVVEDIDGFLLKLQELTKQH